MPGLRQLTLRVNRPNADVNSDRSRVFARMSRLNASEWKQSYKAARGVKLEPDNEVRRLAGVAADNGQVVGVGKDENNKRVEESTSDHPMVLTRSYDPDREGAKGVFEGLSERLRKMFSRRQR